jgi:uncharacterized membrane protein YhaH (DUF805 family)
MDMLETPTTHPALTVPVWQTSLLYGAYCGVAMIFFSLIMYLADIDLMSISGVIILYLAIFVIGFTMAALAIQHQRDHIDSGHISFGKALSVGLLVILVGMLISGGWNYVFSNFIDPGYITHLKEQFAANWGEKMPEEALQQALDGFDTAGSLLQTLKSSLISGVFLGLIIGSITAAVMKREPKSVFLR